MQKRAEWTHKPMQSISPFLPFLFKAHWVTPQSSSVGHPALQLLLLCCPSSKGYFQNTYYYTNLRTSCQPILYRVEQKSGP